MLPCATEIKSEGLHVVIGCVTEKMPYLKYEPTVLVFIVNLFETLKLNASNKMAGDEFSAPSAKDEIAKKIFFLAQSHVDTM